MEAPFFELQGILVINLNLAHPKIEPLRGILTINFHNARAVLHQANFEPIRKKNHVKSMEVSCQVLISCT